MTRTTWIIFAVICAALLGGLIFMSQGNRIDVSNIEQHKALAATEDSGNIADQTKGTTKPKVVIVEYADFQCPGCNSASSVMNDVADTYRDHVQLIYRHFPLSTIHPNARAAAAAAEAAGKQGKFWQMHDKLFASQNEWSQANGTVRSDIFAGYADVLGLNREQFLNDMTSDAIAAKIDFDAALGRAAGVTGTPAIFVDGGQIEGLYKGDKIVTQGTEGAAQLWTNAEAFGKLVIEPKLRDAGVDITK